MLIAEGLHDVHASCQELEEAREKTYLVMKLESSKVCWFQVRLDPAADQHYQELAFPYVFPMPECLCTSH